VTATATTTKSRVPLFLGAGLLVALLLIGLIAGDNSSSKSGPPLSPSSTSGNGTRALVILLRESGADVRLDEPLPNAGAHVALLLHDSLDDRARSELETWVEDGGTLVLADPDSLMAPSQSSFAGAGHISRATCDIPALADVSDLDVPFGIAFEVPAGGQSCFGNRAAAFVVSEVRGQGRVVSIGGPDTFTNTELDQADNSVLAVRLLLRSDRTPVVILDPNGSGLGSTALGSGRTTLGDLIADRVFQAILQLGVAFIVYALWRSRRVGRPVTEPQPVAIAGSQFVRAVGGLHQRSRASERAAAALRFETRRVVSDRFGVPLDLDTATLAELTASRTGLDRTTVAVALSDTPILDEASLVTLAHQLDKIRQEVVDGRSH
jgi:hypothetical protein